MWLLCTYPSLSQLALPGAEVSVFTKTDYAAGTQNWDIERDPLGRVYIANNEGLLIYNGVNWLLYPVPNKTIVRSIAFSADGRLYAGAQNEFGYYASDARGRLVFTSLKGLLPPSVQLFADIWDIEVAGKEVFFRASDIIFRYASGKLTFYKPTSAWLSLKKHRNKIVAHDARRGLLTFNKGNWETTIRQSDLPSGFTISDIKPFGKDTSMVSTAANGLYLFTGNTLYPFVLKNQFTETHFTALDMTGKDYFLAGSYNTGLYKADRKGNISEIISARSGLISNTIRCIHTGSDGCTWIGLDNSIARIDWNNPIRHINPASFNNGSGQGAALHNGNLYFALSTGLQWMPFPDKSQPGKSAIEPRILLNGLTWNLSVWNNRLIVGRDDGLWTVSGQKASQISDATGFWLSRPIPGLSPLKIACGNYLGIRIFGEEKGMLKDFGAIKNFPESSRYLEVDGNDIWVSHPYHGLFRIGLNTGVVKKFTRAEGLPADLDNHVFKLKGKIVFATNQGLYEVHKSGSRIIPSLYYQKLLGSRPIRYLKEDQKGNIWFVQDKMLGVVDFNTAVPVVKFIPELFNHILSGFENIFPYNSGNVLVGSEIGFYNIHYDRYRNLTLPYSTYLTSVKINGNRDSVIYGGFHNNDAERFRQISIPYAFNSISFSFASSFLHPKSAVEFSHYLEGYDKNWSSWGLQHEKEYTNLPEGRYTFHVKSRYGPSFEFRHFTYSFKIKAPWYRTFWAYILYLFLLAFIIALLLKLQKNRLKRKEELRMLNEKIKFEEEQQQIKLQYQLKLEKKEKTLAQLKNEKLEAEIQHKNTELASAAMNLLQKKSFLRKIGEELNKIYLSLKDRGDTTEIKKILHHLSSEEKLDDEWKQFSIYFNNVHSNFLITLKEVFPELNAHEMKLCAYLRMNLSSKEIAQLLNISVRGVEISRYRLRKKLKLQQNEDLFEFLFNIKSDENTKSGPLKDNS